MPLISERSLWDWAEKVAKEQNEPFALVLVEMFKAIDRDELPATFPHRSPLERHDLKAIIAEILTTHSLGIPILLYSGEWGVASSITITSSDMESWLARSIPVEPEPAGTTNLSTGMPGRPKKGKDIIANEFDRRTAAGEALCLLDDEAEALRTWYQNKYPNAQIPTVKTIKNNIRDAHRKWLGTRQQTSPTQGNGPKL
jgi:hypothetical protein